MTPGSLPKLVKLSLKRDLRGTVSSVFGIVIGIASLVFFTGLGLGVAQVVQTKIFPVDSSLIEVVPSQLSLGLLGGGKIDEGVVNRLRALQGVEAAYRKMNVRVPAASVYDGDFFGRQLRMGIEVLAVGVDPEFVKADVQMGDFKDLGPDQPIPSIAASRLLEIYNKSFAPARSLPQLSGAMVIGFAFPVEFNRSFVTAAPAGPVTKTQAQIVGVSDRGLLAGITIPLETARRMNKTANVDAETYSGVALKATSPAQVSALVSEVKAMGLRVDDTERRMAENTGAAVAITTAALGTLSLLICLLAAFNIAHSLSASVRAREREIGLMRAVGATKRDIRRLVMSEALVTGLIGGVIGTGMAVMGSLLLDVVAQRVLPPFPFKPESFSLLPAWLLLLSPLLGMLAAIFGAVRPAQRAASIDPARTLAG